jgi:hypothetical protein
MEGNKLSNHKVTPQNQPLMPPMPMGEPTREDRAFDECIRMRLLFGIPGEQPIVKDDAYDLTHWRTLWNWLLQGKEANNEEARK